MEYKRSFQLILILFISSIFLACYDGPMDDPGSPSFTNADLNGHYVVSLSGKDANGFFAIAGVLVADGHGRISSGSLDINQVPAPIVNMSVSGTYNVGTDGRGAATVTSSAGDFSLVFVIISRRRALVTRFDQSATASGSLDLQSPSAFSTAALAGTLVFNLTGLGPSGGPMKAVGSFTTDPSGNIIHGVQDSSNIGAISTNEALSGGSIRVGSDGRGTALIDTAAGIRNFAFYVVDANHIKLVETDILPALAGDAFRQSGTISNASLGGTFAFTISGNDVAAGGPFVAGGVFSSDGKGSITSGTEDFNKVGMTLLNTGILGMYKLDASGRGIATINNGTTGMLSMALYPTTHGIQALEIDNGAAVSGIIFSQSDELSDTTLKGNYGLTFTGADFAARGEVDAIALLNADGSGAAAGTLDINDAGSTSSGTSLVASYSVDSDGRGALILGSVLRKQRAAIYVLNRDHTLFFDLDPDLVAVGEIERQRDRRDIGEE